MIQIIKPKNAPSRLTNEGVQQTKKDCNDFRHHAADYLTGKRKFEALPSIYNAPEVKETLRVAQNNKCCYCERCFEDSAYLHIEHYRPKGAYKQKRRDKRRFPGYYWLAYDWDNLYLSCHPCNCSHKGDLFPLVDPAEREARGLSHNYAISKEDPLFVNPKDNPREHIRFRGDAPYHLTEKGRVTIEEINLAGYRPIVKARLEKTAMFDRALRIVELSKRHPEDAELANLAQEFQDYLTTAILPSAAFSSMAKDYLKDYFKTPSS